MVWGIADQISIPTSAMAAAGIDSRLMVANKLGTANFYSRHKFCRHKLRDQGPLALMGDRGRERPPGRGIGRAFR